MFIQSDHLLKKLKFAAEGTMGKAAFPEFYKYVLVEYVPESHQIALRAFNGRAHFRAILGEPEQRTIVPDPKGDNFFVFDPTDWIKSYSKIKDQIFLHVDFEKKFIAARSRNATSKISGSPATGFIDIPSDDGMAEPMDVPENFAKAMRRVLWASDPKSMDPACTGIFIKSVDDGENQFIEMVCTNREVIAVSRDFDNIASITAQGIVQYETARSIADLIEDTKECDLFMNEDRIIVISGDYTIVARHIDTQMLAYDKVIEHFRIEGLTETKLSRPHLVTGSEFASQFADENFKQIFLRFGDKSVKIHGSQKDKSKQGSYEIPYVGEGAENARLCITIGRLQSCVKSLECEEVKMIFDASNPRGLIIQPAKEDDLYTEVFTSLQIPQDELNA